MPPVRLSGGGCYGTDTGRDGAYRGGMPNAGAELPPLAYGVATSSYQIEGGADADGRGPSIWDVFCSRPGAIVDGSDGSIACDSYHRLDEDLALVAGLGVDGYRFSIAWPRVQPTGSGRVEPRGLDYYERLVDGLLDRGVEPLPTLYHWDLPQPLEAAGGWPVRDTALRFADYAAAVVERLGDRVGTWATLNEPWCSAFLGYAAGIHAPGRREPAAAYAAAHHLLLAHGLAARALHEQGPGAAVGVVLNLAPVRPEPGAPSAAVDVVDAVQNRLWVDALAEGRYPEALPQLSDDALVRADDLALVAGSADWVGVNYYTPMRIAAVATGAAAGQETAAFPGAPAFGFAPRGPATAMGWEVDPSGLVDVLVWLAGRLPGTPIRVTENGAAYDDGRRAAGGGVADDDRIDYLRAHLAAVDEARAAGAPVVGYLAWTLLDNFEWAEGYTKRFGVVEVERETLRRIPKASYEWYAAHIAAARARR